MELLVLETDAGRRLDAFLADRVADLSRSQAQKAIEQGAVQVNKSCCSDKNYRLSLNDRVTIELPAPKPLSVQAEAIPLDIVFEDRDLLVINKPRQMVVHPAPGHTGGTLVNALLYHCKDLSGIGGIIRPGIVHRLDKDTSGLLIVAKNDNSHHYLAQQLKERCLRREYLVLVHGLVIPREGSISAPIGRHPVHRKRMAVVPGGREAISRYRVLAYINGFTLLKVALETGRTHQVRVHLAHLGYPVVGDPLYGAKERGALPAGLRGKQSLHAHRIAFYHPRYGCLMEFAAPLPGDMRRGIAQLRCHLSLRG